MRISKKKEKELEIAKWYITKLYELDSAYARVRHVVRSEDLEDKIKGAIALFEHQYGIKS